jgi:hypothetical protein
VHCVPAKHWSQRGLFDRNRALWSGWVVVGPTRRFYFAGDTGYFGAVPEIGSRLGPFGLAAVPIGAYEPAAMMQSVHLNPEEALQVGIDVRGERLLGVDESQPVGRFARYEIGASAPVIVDSGYMVSNGPAFSEDCTLMLHSDSLRRVTYRYAVDVRSGAASERVLWKSFAEDDGYPDGMTFDAEDCVWIAHWGAAKLCRYDSEGNRLLTVEIPTSNVSNVCFGGKDMSRMFVTTASQGLSDAQRASQSAAGALLEVSGVDVRGGRSRQVKI